MHFLVAFAVGSINNGCLKPILNSAKNADKEILVSI